ncbi:hypothetical protein FQI62_26490, partial [Escherichia coli]|nr:hypothetical protein [Escherichia coli]
RAFWHFAEFFFSDTDLNTHKSPSTLCLYTVLFLTVWINSVKVFNFEAGVKGFVLLNLCKIFLHHKSNNTFNNTLLHNHENKCIFI